MILKISVEEKRTDGACAQFLYTYIVTVVYVLLESLSFTDIFVSSLFSVCFYVQVIIDTYGYC